jgi:hypothetical protein
MKKNLTRLVAVGACAAAFAAALWHAPAAFDKANSDGSALEHEAALDRALTGSHGIDTSFLQQARSLLPPNATYAIVTGSAVKSPNPNTMIALLPFTAYWLLPRKEVPYPSEAQWVLAYGRSVNGLGVRYTRVVDVAPGISIGEVRS